MSGQVTEGCVGAAGRRATQAGPRATCLPRGGGAGCLVGAGAVFTLGTIGAALSRTALLLIGFRFVMGIGVGISSVVVPMYLSELAPKKVRGKLTSLMQLLVITGIFIAYLVDYALSGAGAWRWMIGIGVIPAVLLMVGIYTQPKSPRWLVTRRDDAEAARGVLLKLCGNPQAAGEELDEIQDSVAMNGRRPCRCGCGCSPHPGCGRCSSSACCWCSSRTSSASTRSSTTRRPC